MPPDGGTIREGSTLSVQVADEGGAGLDLSSIKMLIDSQEVNALYNFEKGVITYELPGSLPLGPHSVQVFAKDLVGNENGGLVWKFVLKPLGPDFNRDGIVDLDDFFDFTLLFGVGRGQSGYNSKYDLDGNRKIDLGDFFIFAEMIGKKI
ncbi:MAG: hypothetical protein AAB911_01855 [Patescibacteria group bacterium]